MADSFNDLSYLFYRTAWALQGVASITSFVFLGLRTLINITSVGRYAQIGQTVLHLVCAVASGAVICILAVQNFRHKGITKAGYKFEITKSALATTIWVCLLIEAIVNSVGSGHYLDRLNVDAAVVVASSVLSLIPFYPTALLAQHQVQQAESLLPSRIQLGESSGTGERHS